MDKIYSKDLIGKKESVTDSILLLNPNQTPMINLLGFSEPVVSTNHYWIEDEVFATKSTVTAAATDSATSLTVQSVEAFRKDVIAQIEEEMVYITEVDPVSKKLTVVRGHAGTTPAAIPAGSEIEVLFVNSEEGADARNARSKARKKVGNVTQIFDESIEVTGTAQTVGQYGITDLYAYEKAKKELEVALQLEKAVINGLELDDGNVRYMRGIRNFIQTNVTVANEGVSIDMLNDISQQVFNNGGLASGGQYAFIVPAKQKRKISDLQNDKLRFVRTENTRGQVVDHIQNDFGLFPIIMNDNLKADELFFIDTNRVKIRPLGDRSFFHTYLGPKGDYQAGQIVGEYTLEFEQEKAHARLKGLK